MSDSWFFDEPDRGLDNARRSSGRLRNHFGMAQLMGAENLLGKARAAFEADDPERAERFIRRAAAMPWDDHEEHFPAVRAATMLLYREVTDALEHSDEDDMWWLDVALATLDEVSGPGRDELASIVHGCHLQEAFFDLTDEERRRITAAVADAPLDLNLCADPDTPEDERAATIRSLIDANLAYRRRYWD